MPWRRTDSRCTDNHISEPKKQCYALEMEFLSSEDASGKSASPSLLNISFWICSNELKFISLGFGAHKRYHMPNCLFNLLYQPAVTVTHGVERFHQCIDFNQDFHASYILQGTIPPFHFTRKIKCKSELPIDLHENTFSLFKH